MTSDKELPVAGAALTPRRPATWGDRRKSLPSFFIGQAMPSDFMACHPCNTSKTPRHQSRCFASDSLASERACADHPASVPRHPCGLLDWGLPPQSGGSLPPDDPGVPAASPCTRGSLAPLKLPSGQRRINCVAPKESTTRTSWPRRRSSVTTSSPAPSSSCTRSGSHWWCSRGAARASAGVIPWSRQSSSPRRT